MESILAVAILGTWRMQSVYYDQIAAALDTFLADGLQGTIGT
jgi:hypothetical protein